MDEGVRELFGGGNFVHLATVLPDGSPHTVPLWTIVHGGVGSTEPPGAEVPAPPGPEREQERIAFFTQPASRKARNLARDPRVALSVVDRANPYRRAWARGRLVETLEGEAALEVIDRISDAYIGRPFPMRSGVVYLVEVERSDVHTLPF
jgi:nitroimidazol reductase NimA-like FMN-containing flavoprotein (pyridoxamine 5'-phosphate oxidase superfamily)